MVTCGSSDSTWLKSGFTVPSTVILSASTILTSTPPRTSVWLALRPSVSSSTRAPANVAYGMNWRLRPGDTPVTPAIVPNCDEKPLMRFVMPGQNAFSLRTGMLRWSAMPHAPGSVPDGKRRLLNGIAISTA